LKNDKLIAQLHKKYKNKLVNTAYSVVKDIDLAEDVVQEVFVNLSRILDTFEKSCSYYTFLYRMTINRSIDEYRKKKRISSKTTVLHDNVSIKSKDIDLILSVKKAIHELDDIYRIPIILIDYDGLSYEEGARILNISLPAFRSRLIRGRELLIKKIKLKEIY
jgi:RNA polymerase sigma-70 factor (ECF subfamily)